MAMKSTCSKVAVLFCFVYSPEKTQDEDGIAYFVEKRRALPHEVIDCNNGV